MYRKIRVLAVALIVTACAVLTPVTAFAAVDPTAQGGTAIVVETSAQIDTSAQSETAASSTVAELPEIAAASCCLINASTGEVLFAKDGKTAYYPASITKLMTALLVMENCSLDEKVTFSKSATTNLESGAVSIGLTEGDVLTVRDCMYALLLKSANEVANGLAEHVAGSVPAFAEMMNKKAKELGCTGSHFVNPNGLNDKNHYVTAHDMALIGRAALANDTIRQIDTTASYTTAPTKNNPNGVTVKLNNKILMPSNENYYQYAIGGKTGYTSRAGSTLVTAAEKDGVRLVAVVLKSTAYMGHYADTRKLFEYGFSIVKAQPAGNAGSQQTVQDPTIQSSTVQSPVVKQENTTSEKSTRVSLSAPGGV